MEAGDSGLSQMQETGGPGLNRPMEKQHPLKLTLILQKVFELLQLDEESLQICRQVCSTWASSINLPILINSNIKQFNNLMSKPEAILVCRKVTLGKKVDIGDCSPTIFLETNGSEIENLKILSPFNVLPFLCLPKLCPNLTELDILFQPRQFKSDLQIPKFLEQTWENPFPNLKSFTTRINEREPTEQQRSVGKKKNKKKLKSTQNKTLKNVTNFAVLVLHKALRLNTLALINWDSEVLQNIAKVLIPRPEIFQRIRHIHLGFVHLRPDDLSCLSMTPNLNVTVLEIKHIPRTITTEQFSTLLKNVAPTLKQLTMKDRLFGNPYARSENFRVHFTCEMSSLKYLKFVSFERTNILVCSASENGNFCNPLRMLPNIETFIERSAEDNRDFSQLGRTTFWETIFPANSTDSQFVHNALTTLVTHRSIPLGIVEQVARCFPNLKTVVLSVTIESMREVVIQMKSLRIEDLRVMYHGTEETLNAFTSAIAGISYENCEHYANIDNREEIHKVHTSLAEWEDLRHFTVCYVNVGPTRYSQHRIPLNDVSITEGFTKLRQLQSLKMMNFEMNSSYFKTLFENIPLRSFRLVSSAVVFSGSEDEEDATNIQGILTKYPNVVLRDMTYINMKPQNNNHAEDGDDDGEFDEDDDEDEDDDDDDDGNFDSDHWERIMTHFIYP